MRRISRRELLRGVVVVAGAPAASAFLTACGANPPSSAGQSTPAPAAKGADAAAVKTGDIVIAQKSAIETFDPTQSINSSTHTVIVQVLEPLVRLSEDGSKFVGELAESWETPNETTWRFKLRKGVKFHNGEELTSDAVKFSFDAWMDPVRKPKSFTTSNPIKEVKVVDPYTVDFITQEPFAILLTILSLNYFVFEPKYIKEKGWDEAGAKPIGTGPYKLVEWKKGDQAKMTAFDGYWKGKPTISNVTWRAIPEDASRIAALQNGEVDFIDAVPFERVKELEAGKNTRVTMRTAGQQVYIGLDTLQFEPLKNKKVRQALNYAVNVDGIVKDLLLGQAKRLNGPLFPQQPGYDTSIPPYPYDPAKAKAMLAEAGYANGFDMEFVVPTVSQSMIKSKEVAEAVVENLRQVGVRATLKLYDDSTWASMYSGKKFQSYMYSWGTAPESGRLILVLLESKQRGYYYQNPEADKLINAYMSTIDPAKRVEVGKQMHKFLYDDSPWIFMYQQVDAYGASQRLDWQARADFMQRAYDMKLK